MILFPSNAPYIPTELIHVKDENTFQLSMSKQCL